MSMEEPQSNHTSMDTSRADPLESDTLAAQIASAEPLYLHGWQNERQHGHPDGTSSPNIT